VSLWLVPSESGRESLVGLIARLAERFGGPHFEPHVTLLPGLAGSYESVLTVAAELARRTPPLEIQPTRAARGDAYFRCLFLEVALTRELGAAHELARTLFDARSEAPFFPHLSLAYGWLTQPEKERFLGEIGAEIPGAFRVDTLDVFHTEGLAASWRRVGRFALTGA
jgi:2'-5' RNA ligase